MAQGCAFFRPGVCIVKLCTRSGVCIVMPFSVYAPLRAVAAQVHRVCSVKPYVWVCMKLVLEITGSSPLRKLNILARQNIVFQILLIQSPE